MFTGIITELGILADQNTFKKKDSKYRFQVSWNTKKIVLGSSISCNGVCLTVVKTGKNWFEVDISNESINKTNLSQMKIGDFINLEKSLKIGDEIGGHLITGHIDGQTKILQINKNKSSYIVWLQLNKIFSHFIASKGSIALNGISLTVNDVEKDMFSVNIIPHTWEQTTMKYRKVNDLINIEIDIISRYVNRYLENIKID